MPILFLCCGLSLWIAYGLVREDIVIIAANALSLSMLAFILYFKLRKVQPSAEPPVPKTSTNGIPMPAATRLGRPPQPRQSSNVMWAAELFAPIVQVRVEYVPGAVLWKEAT